jgi:ribose-phosphate pyrophosphokinase
LILVFLRFLTMFRRFAPQLLGATVGLAVGGGCYRQFSQPNFVLTQERFLGPSFAHAEKAEERNKRKIKLFTGNSNPDLAREISSALECEIGNATVSRFEDGEVNVVVHDNVRGQDVYIMQSTCTPVNENLMELMLMVSTMRRASARRITAVIPYYGYARQDRKMTARVPISAADVARLLEAMGVDRVIAVDLHCGQIQGFFGPRVPVDNLDGGTVGVDYFGARKDLVNPVIVSPDAGGVYRAKKFREHLDKKYNIKAGLAMIIKQRHKPGEIERMDLVGSVTDSDVIIVDDMIDTGRRGTCCFLCVSKLTLSFPSGHSLQGGQ